MRTLLSVLMLITGVQMASADEVLLHAAGSLRASLSDVAKAYEAVTGTRVTMKFGPSGFLKEAIENGERAEVFASANMEHPRALAALRKSGPVVLFARNQLCALVREGLAVAPEALLERMLDPAIKLGTSTPKADPSGDYAFASFARAEAIRPGARALLERKALQLTGGPNSPQAAAGKSLYGKLVAEGAADIFLTYCTNALAARQEYPTLGMVALPDQLAVGADYGLTVIDGASPAAFRFAMFILSRDGQETLAKHGFAAPALPR